MEIKKTTLLSFLVCIAGILAEIIFRDVLSKSVFGVVLSVLLAVVIIVLAYFVYDGIDSYLKIDREMTRKHQEEYEQKMYHILNEQLQFEKAIYKEVRTLVQADENQQQTPAESVLPKAEPVAAEVPAEQLEKLMESINENTTMTAKLIAKYVNRNTADLKIVLEQNQNDIQKALKDLESSQKALVALSEQKRQD